MILRDIKRRIRSVRNTQQITRAMSMVAASKLRRAQARVLAGRPYAGRLAEMVREVGAGMPEAGEADIHPYLASRRVVKRALVVVAADRGLCGAFNSHIVRRAFMAWEKSQPGGLGLVLVGKKTCDAFKAAPVEVLARFPRIGREITPAMVAEVSEAVGRLFRERVVDQVDLLYSRFISALRREIVEERLLPVRASEVRASEARATGGLAAPGAGGRVPGVGPQAQFLLEPSSEEIFRVLMPRYLRTRVRCALQESFASEQAARMTAMDTATRNAEELVDSLTLEMNRARQAAITKELADIVGSAEAMA